MRAWLRRAGWVEVGVLLLVAAALPRLPILADLVGGLAYAAVYIGGLCWGAGRFRSRSPFHQREYGAWLASTPWMPGMRLPLGPLRPESSDLLWFLAFPAAAWLLDLPAAGIAVAAVLPAVGYVLSFSLSAWRIQPLTRATALGVALLPWTFGSLPVLAAATAGVLTLAAFGTRVYLQTFARRLPPLPPQRDAGRQRFLRSTLRGSVLTAVGPAPPFAGEAAWAPAWLRGNLGWFPVLLLLVAGTGLLFALGTWSGDDFRFGGTRFGARVVLIAVLIILLGLKGASAARLGVSLGGRVTAGRLFRLADDWFPLQFLAVLAVGALLVIFATSGPVAAVGGDPLVWIVGGLIATQVPRLLDRGRDRWELTGRRRVWTGGLQASARRQAVEAAKATTKALESEHIVGETWGRGQAAEGKAG